MDVLLRVWVYFITPAERLVVAECSLSVSVLPGIACQTLDLIGSGCVVVSAPQDSLHGT